MWHPVFDIFLLICFKGKYYLKIGRGPRGDELHTLQQISDWFKSEGVNDAFIDTGLGIFKSLLPGKYTGELNCKIAILR